jgi:hypothetical protein
MTRRIVIALFACFVPVMSAAPCPEVNAEPFKDGSLIRIRHDQPQVLTAFLIEIVDYPGNRFAHLEDELFRDSIPAGKERRLVVSSLMPGTVPDYLKVTAAIYGDGTVCGTLEKVKLILDARRENLQQTREIIGRIQKAQTSQGSTASLTAELRARAQSASPSVKGVFSHVADQLDRVSLHEVLRSLRVVEQTLAASKPSL